jgi:hypothetical protein
MTYALEVQIPQGWSGDVDTLGTMFLSYIPQEEVNNLSSMIRAPSSRFYEQGGVAGQLANSVIPSFPLMAALNVLSATAASSGTNQTTKTRRTNVIIGICATSAGIAAIVTIWWTVRHKRRKDEAKHRRLSELSDPNWSGGVYGTHDDDRRTSFFYAQDQLQAGYYGVPATAVPQAPPPGSIGANVMKQRLKGHKLPRRPPNIRQVSISTPVLQFSSIDY